jgi:hypothetical protein
MRYIDLVGTRFGHLVVLKKVRHGKLSRYRLLCKCDCGKEWEVRPGDIKRTDGKATISCGCYAAQSLGDRRRTHGMKNAPEYKIWKSMRRRCINPDRPDYRFYGAKGITVCERWDKFENFFADMGKRPDGLTLDRIDNSGNYTPENCRWATWETQFANRPNLPNPAFMVLITHNGETHSISEWGRIAGIGQLLAGRLHRGWTFERAFTEPVHRK